MKHNFYAPNKKLKLSAYIFKYKKEFWLQAGGGILYNTVVVFGAVFLGRTIDAAEQVYRNQATISVFYSNLMLFLGFTLIFQFARYFKRFYMRILVNQMSCDIRAGLLENIFAMPLSTLSGEKTGDLMSRMIGDVDAVGASVQTTITELWDTVLLMLSYFTACMLFSSNLTLLASIPIPFTLLFALMFRNTLYSLALKSRKAASKINVHLQHNVTGIMLLRLFGLEQADNERFEHLLKDQYKWQVISSILQSGMGPIYVLFANLGVLLVLGLGGQYVINQTWTIGTFTAYLSMFIAMASRTNVAAKVMNTWHGAKASWDRICEMLNEEYLKNQSEVNSVVSINTEGLSVKALSFTYPFSKEQNIKNISFEAKNGEIIGVTGPVGSGKSALAAAISGLYTKERNPLIAFMDSSHFIFSDDVLFNITLGGENENVEKAVLVAELSDDITQFESGIHTRLMERGVRVSGGQRQRVALARAWASDCRILILDDPFSAIDVDMERKIMKNLRDNIGEKIILLFSHRLSTFDKVDRIILLKKGEIAEEGTHNELFKQNGLYKNIYSAQVFLGGEEYEE